MRRWVRGAVVVGTLAMVAGCFGIANEAYMAEASPAAQPAPGKAMVKVVRMGGSGLPGMVPVWDREKLVGHSNVGTVIVYECDPGEHLFVATARGGSAVLKANVQADKVYDIVVELRQGTFSGPKARIYASKPTNNFSKMTGVFDRLRHITPNPVATEGYENANRPGMQNLLARYDSGRWVGIVEEITPTDHRP